MPYFTSSPLWLRIQTLKSARCTFRNQAFDNSSKIFQFPSPPWNSLFYQRIFSEIPRFFMGSLHFARIAFIWVGRVEAGGKIGLGGYFLLSCCPPGQRANLFCFLDLISYVVTFLVFIYSLIYLATFSLKIYSNWLLYLLLSCYSQLWFSSFLMYMM